MRTRSNLATALVLIAVGLWFLAIELSPPVREFAYGVETWPLPIIGIGALLGVLGLLAWVPAMLIPATIVAGMGGLLYWQNSTGDWGSWAYAWALIPSFVGLGLVFFGLLSRKRPAWVVGGWIIFYGLLLFVVFGSFLGGSKIIAQYWPVLLIGLGVLFLGQGLMRRR